MSSNVQDRLLKMREERAAREKARIEKLRELNLKKYNSNANPSNLPATQKLVKSNSVSQIKNTNAPVKNNFHVNGTIKRPITVPLPQNSKDLNLRKVKPNETKEAKTNYLLKNIAALHVEKKVDKVDKSKSIDRIDKSVDRVDKTVDRVDKSVDKVDKAVKENRAPNKNPIAKEESKVVKKIDRKPAMTNKLNNDKLFDRKAPVKTDEVLAEIKPFKSIDPKLSRSIPFMKPNIPAPSRKSNIPKIDTAKETVFDRLYRSKSTTKTTVDEVEKLHNDPSYLKKVIKNSSLILKRHSCFDTKEVIPVRRSISAVHFKRMSKNEASNCIHKWASIGDKLNDKYLTIDEGESIKEDRVVSAVKSERKRVTFLTPKFITPRPDELQVRLKSWLQKRGKSLDKYHHLQCFGIHHLANPANKIDLNDENKENIAVNSDSDDGSYMDNSVEQKDALCEEDNIDIDKWRPNDSMATELNETTDFNETTVTSADTFVTMDELVIGALNDLTELLKEGFDWEHAARYLRAIRARFPHASQTAAYWECRAGLEERRGDLHASVSCWEEAVAKGTERNVVEASLDTLLNKFMQLKISPRAGASKQPDPKMLDVKNVFKSTIIRFAVQQAKLRQSEAMYTVTPVRRSGRLSLCPTPRQTTPRATPRTPLQICETVRQVAAIAPKHVFNVNKNLVQTP